MKTLKDIGEFGLIAQIEKRLGKGKAVVGIGDDTAVVRVGSKLLAYTTDSLVEGVHFSFSWFSPDEVGKKAIAVNVSDVGAMGGKPKYALVSLVVPKNTSLATITGIYDGMYAAAQRYGVSIVGGNVSKGKQFVIDVSMIGEVQKKHLCLRSDAKPGDFIMVSGHLGGAAAGLDAYKKNKSGFEVVKKLFRNPVAQSGKVKRYLGSIHALQDISDGLVADLGIICKQSGVGAVLYGSNIPIADETRKVAAVLGKDVLSYALFGADDLALVYTVSEKNLGKVAGYFIGEIRQKRGVYFYAGGKESRLEEKGFDHFGS
jgi:thiamine-monophosphate kinase